LVKEHKITANHKWVHPISGYPIVDHGKHFDTNDKIAKRVVVYQNIPTLLKESEVAMLTNYNKKAGDPYKKEAILLNSNAIYKCCYLFTNVAFDKKYGDYLGDCLISFIWVNKNIDRYRVEFKYFNKNKQHCILQNALPTLAMAIKYCKDARTYSDSLDD